MPTPVWYHLVSIERAYNTVGRWSCQLVALRELTLGQAPTFGYFRFLTHFFTNRRKT